MSSVLNELRQALRALRKSPAFTLAAVITLALGIGPNVAILSLIYGTLLKPLPYRAPGRLVEVAWQFGQGSAIDALTASEYTYWKTHSPALRESGAYSGSGGGFNLVVGGTPSYVRGEYVSAELFRVLGVRPALGRDFTPDEDRPHGANAALISYGLWQGRFGADSAVIGRVMQLNGADYPVVGVMPRGFTFDAPSADVWLPLQLSVDPRDQGHNTSVIARLPAGVSLAEAQRAMPAMLARFRQDVPGHVGPHERGVLLKPYRSALVADVRTPLLLLSGAVGLVLLVAVADVAGLFLARADARRREVAVRAALGAGGWARGRLILIESVVVAIAAGALGVVLAAWSLELLSHVGARALPALQSARLDLPVLAGTFALSVVVGILSGLTPGWRAARAGSRETLAGTDRALGGKTQRGRSVLVATEIALSLVLLTGAGLLLASLVRLLDVRAGFDPNGVTTVQMSLTGPGYGTAAAVSRFESAVTSRLAALPGVTAVGTSSSLPLERGLNVWITGGAAGPEHQTYVQQRVVSGDFFSALRIPLMRGRFFDASDVAGSGKVALVNATLAGRLWPDGDAVGREIADGLRIVGIVGDVHEMGLEYPAPNILYVPQVQLSDAATRMVNGWFPTAWVVRAGRPIAAAAVRGVVRTVDPAQPIVSVRAMDDVVSGSLATRRFIAMLLELFAGLALVLAAIGVYGLITYAVGRRRREIGLRVALGATRPAVLTMVLRQGLVLAVAGAAIGLVGAVALTRFLRSFLFGIGTADPLVLGGASIVLIGVALVASWLPAHRAAAVDPMTALRSE